VKGEVKGVGPWGRTLAKERERGLY